jgi:6-phosphofructokinase 1
MEAADKIKESAVNMNRLFLVEAMGRNCGYLPFMGGLVSGAERVFLAEDPFDMDDLRRDIAQLKEKALHTTSKKRQCSLFVKSEMYHSLFTMPFLAALFEAESQGLYDVRQSILGHLQQVNFPISSTLEKEMSSYLFFLQSNHSGRSANAPGPNPRFSVRLCSSQAPRSTGTRNSCAAVCICWAY